MLFRSLFGDVHDPQTEVSQAIRDRGGYTLMPELGTLPANHYLPRRKTGIEIHEEQLRRVSTPLNIDALPAGMPGPTTEDHAT